MIGEIDRSTHDVWRRGLDSATASKAPTRLELSQLSFIDARGAAMLIAAAHRQPGSAPLTLTRPPTVLRRMLTLLGPAESAKFVIGEREAP